MHRKLQWPKSRDKKAIREKERHMRVVCIAEMAFITLNSKNHNIFDIQKN